MVPAHFAVLYDSRDSSWPVSSKALRTQGMTLPTLFGNSMFHVGGPTEITDAARSTGTTSAAVLAKINDEDVSSGTIGGTSMSLE